MELTIEDRMKFANENRKTIQEFFEEGSAYGEIFFHLYEKYSVTGEPNYTGFRKEILEIACGYGIDHADIKLFNQKVHFLLELESSVNELAAFLDRYYPREEDKKPKKKPKKEKK